MNVLIYLKLFISIEHRTVGNSSRMITDCWTGKGSTMNGSFPCFYHVCRFISPILLSFEDESNKCEDPKSRQPKKYLALRIYFNLTLNIRKQNEMGLPKKTPQFSQPLHSLFHDKFFYDWNLTPMVCCMGDYVYC